MLEERLWPSTGARARLKFYDETSVGASVFDVDADKIELSVRTDAHRVRGTEGTVAEIEWNTEANHVYVRGTVLAVDLGVPVRCTVRFDAPAKAIQRRSYVRVPLTGALPRVDVTIAGTAEEGRMVDISEGGMRIRVPEELGVTKGSLVHVSVDLDGTQLELPSKVIRVLPVASRAPGGDAEQAEQVEIGVRFEENDDIRRWVLAEQLRRRNRE
jgi:c-di-GMP-binding flagellar brake protein YcgR